MNEHERLKLIRDALKIKQGDFASRISTTQGHISDIENARKSLSDRTIKLICLEFNVNEEWLRTENGEMLLTISAEDSLSTYYREICTGSDTFIKNFYTYVYGFRRCWQRICI